METGRPVLIRQPGPNQTEPGRDMSMHSPIADLGSPGLNELSPTGAAQRAADSSHSGPQFAQTLGTLLNGKNSDPVTAKDTGGLVEGTEPGTEPDGRKEGAETNEFLLSQATDPALRSGDTNRLTRFADQHPAATDSLPGQGTPVSASTTKLVQAGAAETAAETAISGKSLPTAGKSLPGPVMTDSRIGPPLTQETAMMTADETPLFAGNTARAELHQQFRQRENFWRDKFAEPGFTRDSVEHTDKSLRSSETQLADRSLQLQFLQALGSTAKTEVDSSGYFNTASQNASSTQPGATLAPRVDSAFDLQLATESTRSNATKPEIATRDFLATLVGNAKWHADFAGKLRVLSQANVSTVELNLNPAELGAIDIRIQSLDDGTIINFFTANANTREVIDASLPRLRELLSDSGIELQHGDVSDRETAAGEQEHRPGEDRFTEPGEEPATDLSLMFRSRREQNSVVDHYV